MTYLNPKFADLPWVKLRPAPTDDDINFQSDIDYLRDLLRELRALRPLPGFGSDQLEAALTEVRTMRVGR